MLRLLWLVPTLPLMGFLTLVIGNHRLPPRVVAAIGVGSVGIAALVAVAIAIQFFNAPPPHHVYVQPLWLWMHIGTFSPVFGLYLDTLSMVMMLVITVVGFLIHLYSAEYMRDDASYARFFAYMNLFVAAMLMLVLGDNLLVLYLGWEGVGLASYLLIGFWYQIEEYGAAARKAFVVTRVGDTAMMIGLFVLFLQLGTLDIQQLMQRATSQWPVGSTLAVVTAALLLGGAVGKSAQLPLHTWLPDAMAGPTPVSALIHAATMVTAGVYLIARTHVLFELAPVVQSAVAVIGALGLLIAGFTALTQTDIKRILAYSTLAQIGYMFLALGVGAWSAAIFHLMTHAFFKALLFLAAGAVIIALHHEQNIFRMGGLWRRQPLVFWSFLIGASALSAVPLITSGFFSKDLILTHTWVSPQGGIWLWIAGIVGAFLTGLYIFRLVFIVFFGAPKTEIGHGPGKAIALPLIVLSVLSITGGWVELPPTLGDAPLFSAQLHHALPASVVHLDASVERMLQIFTSAISLLGIALAYWLFWRKPRTAASVAAAPGAALLRRFWFSGWGFDWLYERLIVRPFIAIARLNRHDVVDTLYHGIAFVCQVIHYTLSNTQNGRLRWYTAGVAGGSVLVVALMVAARWS